MVANIKKRDGRIVNFNKEKITRAIYKAATAVGGNDYDTAERISEKVVSYLYKNYKRNECPTVEDIQDAVERILIETGHVKTAKEYILYRSDRTRTRESNTRLMKTYQGITFQDAEDNDLMRENANVNGNTAMGAMLKYGSEGAKEFYHMHILNPEHSKAHKEGIIHIHDLDFLTLTMTCCQIDIIGLFKNGFSTGHGHLREPQDITSYASLAAIAIQSNQNDMHGGQSIPNFDYGIAPGVAKTYIKLYKLSMAKAIDLLCNVSYEEATIIAKDCIAATIEKTGLKPQLEMKPDYTNQEAEYLLEALGEENEIFIPKIQSFTCQCTTEETNEKTFQAMEAFIHNLNTMHCLPYSERIWVYDNDDNIIKLLPIGEVCNTFAIGKYKVFSLNKETGKTELKLITEVSKKDNNRDLVELKSKSGHRIKVTTNHKIMTLDGINIVDKLPEDIETLLLPRGLELPIVSNKIFIEKYKNTKYLNNYVTVTKEFAELMGYYVADGSIIGDSTLVLTVCDKVDFSHIEDLVSTIFDVEFTNNIITYGEENKPKEIRIPIGVRLSKMIKDKFGESSKNKMIPIEILCANSDIKLSFLNAYLICDGRSDCKYSQCSSISIDLIKQLNIMILSLGELPCLNNIVMDNNILYELSIGNQDNFICDISRVLNIFNVNVSDKVNSNSKDEYVYDISVQDNENFLTEDCIFVHNSRAGAQVPFSSINFGTDSSPEGRMVIKNVLLATERGLGNNETPIFPISIFKIKKGISYEKGDPNYDLFKLACKVSAKRLFPNFSFLDASYNKHESNAPIDEVAYMGCRTRVVSNSYDTEKAFTYGRGNLSFTSVNLPYMAITEKGNINKFFIRLDETIDIIIDQLLERFEIQAKKKVKNFPFLMGQGVWIDSDKLKPNDEVREVIKHGTLTMGFIGLAETLKVLIGYHHGESNEAQELGLKIVNYMRDRMDKATEKYNLNFSLIGSPAEGLSGRFIGIDKERFGIIEGVTDREYYTNSFHVPVYYPINAFDKIKIEAPYHELCNGGHISYVELDGDPLQNVEAFESIIRCMAESNIGYGSINHPVDRDPICGYNGIIGEECPKCGRKETEELPFERIRRITGYLVGDMTKWNDAKKSEEHDRVKHMTLK